MPCVPTQKSIWNYNEHDVMYFVSHNKCFAVLLQTSTKNKPFESLILFRRAVWIKLLNYNFIFAFIFSPFKHKHVKHLYRLKSRDGKLKCNLTCIQSLINAHCLQVQGESFFERSPFTINIPSPVHSARRFNTFHDQVKSSQVELYCHSTTCVDI